MIGARIYPLPSHSIIVGLVELRSQNWPNLEQCCVIHSKMKITLLILSVLSAIIVAPVLGGPLMTDAQLEQTLADKNTMQKHIRCALGEGPCDPVGRRLRTLAPLVLRGACPQCSPQETRHIRRTLAFVQRNYPWEWAKIVRQNG